MCIRDRPVTDHIVVYPIGVNHIWAELHVFPILCQLLEPQLKGQLRRNGAQGSDHPLKPLGANQRKGCLLYTSAVYWGLNSKLRVSADLSS